MWWVWWEFVDGILGNESIVFSSKGFEEVVMEILY